MISRKKNTKRINEIVELMDKYAASYYNEGVSLVPDHEYDALYDELQALDPNHPRLSQIGAPPEKVTEWKKEKHKIPMGSLNKVNTEEEFRKWCADTGVDEFIIMDKLDGSSIGLEYGDEDCKLQKAITRGQDGLVGDDICPNVIRMKNVKQEAIDNFSARGEILLTTEDFDEINDILVKEGTKELANPRNGATGIAQRYDGRFSEKLTIMFYDITGDFATEEDKLEYLEKWGFKTCFWKKVTVDEAVKIYKDYDDHIRNELNYQIDGLVIKCNDIDVQHELGLVNKRPKGQIAWKFGASTAIAKVIDVKWVLGRSRHVTPVIYIEPTKIAGVVVRKMTAHNLDIFRKLGLYKGCKILFKRANDVIPVPIRVVEE